MIFGAYQKTVVCARRARVRPGLSLYFFENGLKTVLLR